MDPFGRVPSQSASTPAPNPMGMFSQQAAPQMAPFAGQYNPAGQMNGQGQQQNPLFGLFQMQTSGSSSAPQAMNWSAGAAPAPSAPAFNPMAMAAFMSNFMNPGAQAHRAIGTPDDDDLLVHTLAEAHGRTYRQALDSLHMNRGHPATAWKDYYLDHCIRLNKLVVAKRGVAPSTSAKKPQFPPSPESNTSALPTARRSSLPSAQSQSAPAKRVPTHKRSPIPRLVAKPSADSISNRLGRIPIASVPPSLPRCPSRSPTPPTLIISGTRGNRFTPQDKVYFSDFLLWELKCDPSITRQELCKRLEEKVPHHSAGSWNSYWTNNNDLPDRIMNAARGERDEDDEDEDDRTNDARSVDNWSENGGAESDGQVPPVRLPPIRLPAQASPKKESIEMPTGDFWYTKEEDDRALMGASGETFTAADVRMIARRLASPDWASVSASQSWKTLENTYPQRTWKSWSEGYRKRQSMIDKMVELYRPPIEEEQKHGRASSSASGSSKRKSSEDRAAGQVNEGAERAMDKRQRTEENQYAE